MQISLEAPKFHQADGGHGTTAFAICEEADEKAIFQNARMAIEISSAISTASPLPQTLEQKVDHFRVVAAGIPSFDPSASGEGMAPLDASELTPSLPAKLFDLLLEPGCPSPAVSKALCMRILLAAIDMLTSGGPVVDLPLPTGSQRQVIVGDTHGQLQDVLTILLTHGVPSASNRYVFNGDIADRGPNACEIFMLVLLFQLLCPGSVVVTRGNHEAADINERPARMGGGFLDEVQGKYDNEMFDLFQLYFTHMPVVATIGGQIVVVHGGLSRHTHWTLETMRGMPYRRDIPATPGGGEEGKRDSGGISTGECEGKCDGEGEEAGAREAGETAEAETVLFDLMWSDPQDDADGVGYGGRGDDTIKFGPDVTRSFWRQVAPAS